MSVEAFGRASRDSVLARLERRISDLEMRVKSAPTNARNTAEGGKFRTISQTAHGFSAGKAIGRLNREYDSDQAWELADEDRLAFYDMHGIVHSTSDANTFRVHIHGYDTSATTPDIVTEFLRRGSPGTLNDANPDYALNAPTPWAIVTPYGRLMLPAGTALASRVPGYRLICTSDTNHDVGKVVRYESTYGANERMSVVLAAHGDQIPPLGVVEETIQDISGTYRHVVAYAGTTIDQGSPSSSVRYLSETAGSTTTTRPTWGVPYIIYGADTWNLILKPDPTVPPSLATCVTGSDTSASGSGSIDLQVHVDDSSKFSCEVEGVTRWREEVSGNVVYEAVFHWHYVQTPHGAKRTVYWMRGSKRLSTTVAEEDTDDGSGGVATIYRHEPVSDGGIDTDGNFSIDIPGYGNNLDIVITLDTNDEQLEIDYTHTGLTMDHYVMASGPVFS